jgi:hypothetical protein
MNNLRLFTSEKKLDQDAASQLRAVLLKISLQSMKPSVFKYCQYVFLSYSQSMEPDGETDNFNEIEKSLVEINSTSKVFDNEILANVLQYFRVTQSSFKLRISDTAAKSKNDAEILKLSS